MDDTVVMRNVGYFQLKVNEGGNYTIKLKPGSWGEGVYEEVRVNREHCKHPVISCILTQHSSLLTILADRGDGGDQGVGRRLGRS